MWENDLCDFVDVTVGLSRLQTLLRDLNPAGGLDLEPAGEGGRRILLVPAPGEQHTFGISMVQKFFRMSGWDVWGGTFGVNVDVLELVRCEPFAVVGFSISTEGRLPALKGQIATLRRESCNPSIGVLVGGSLFAATPDLVALVGADATASDGPGAVLSAESLLDSTTRAC
jgi:methanogenic corrinoid protein MtbC1